MTGDLTKAAFRWLTLERNCITVLTERTPRWGIGQPDVLGVTKGRYLIEVEVKVSMSDFRHNAEKWHIVNRNPVRAPKLYWFLVPEPMIVKCLPELPEWAGLLSCNPKRTAQLTEHRPSPVNSESRKLSVKEMAVLFRKQTLELMSAQEAATYAEIYRREPEYQI